MRQQTVEWVASFKLLTVAFCVSFFVGVVVVVVNEHLGMKKTFPLYSLVLVALPNAGRCCCQRQFDVHDVRMHLNVWP